MSGDHRHGTAHAVGVTLIVNLTLTAAKWAAFAVTGSPSLFGEAAHSTADSLNPLVLWIGYRRSRRPSDSRHPLGHGREAFFWSLIAAEMMLIIGAAFTAYHGVQTILGGERPAISVPALVIMGMALVGEGYSFLIVRRRMREESGRGRHPGAAHSRNPVLLALLVENGTDILGVLLALAGYGLYALTGNPLWDACFSLAIAGVLAVSSLFLINRNRSLIIGEAGPIEIERRITAAAQARPSVAEVRRVVTIMRSPHDIACRITVRWDMAWFARCRAANDGMPSLDPVVWTLARVSDESAALRADIARAAPEVTDVIVETI